jgi:GT2 family glycosyltransferase
MKVNCVILSYNHPDLTSRCVSAALNFFKEQDILLVHNGSEKKHQTQLQRSFPEIQHHEMQQNKGYAGGANCGLSKAFHKADRILFLTNDCELLKFEYPESTQPLFAAPQILKRKTEQIDSLGGYLIPEKGLVGHLKSIEEFETFAGRKYIPGSAFLIDRQIWSSGIRFQEALGTYWEDVLFAQEAQARGFHLSLAPGILIRHGIGKTCHKDPYYTSYLFQRNRRWVSQRFNKTFAQKSQFWWHYTKDTAKLLARSFAKKDLQKSKLLFKAVSEKSNLMSGPIVENT